MHDGKSALTNVLFKIVALLLGFAASSVQAEDGPAAIVADFNRPELVSIQSPAGERQLQLGAGLAAGETVSVGKGGYLKLLVGKQCVIIGEATAPDEGCTITNNEGAYTVPESGLLSGMAARYQRFQKVLSWWDPKTESRVMRSREGLAANIPALAEADQAFLIAGSRSLHVEWVDGKAPFKVSVADATGKELAAQSQLQSRQAIVPITIEDGAVYRLTLESAGNVVATYVLVGRPAGNLADDDSEAALLRAMKIMEAVSASDGAWALEAAQIFRTMQIDERIRQAALDAVNFADWP